MARVELTGVRKDFGPFTAVSRIDLDIPSGALVALLGPSGCGKTTCLRMIAGLDAPTEGAILFDGVDMRDVPVQARDVGMVFQRFALFPHMTVENNVLFGLKVRGTPKPDARARLDDILDVVQLREFRHRFPAQLSGGQMQRVAIARTLITNPRVLMMDEPLANLDTGLRGEMRQFIRTLQQRLGITTIFVTHDQVEAMELADQVAVIFDGRVAQYDRPDTLYHRPQSVDVARFMGARNLFEAQLNGAGLAQTGFGDLQFEAPHRAGPAQVLLRAEAIDLHEAPPADEQNVIAGVIKTREFFGSNVNYGVDCLGTQVTVSEPSRRMLEAGHPVWLSIAPHHIWVIQS
ncbi:MAG: ABC transporter ATP-binding protein [Pseudomonadota bacterium]